MRAVILAALVAVCAFAQDPQTNWLSYATASCPAGTRITSFSGEWDVPGSPQPSSASYSPWIGVETSDNLNLLQPVNPWLGSGWSFYTEYYQWSPTYNSNSNQVETNSGNRLQGSIVYNGDSQQSYTINQVDATAGTSSSQTIPVQQNNMGQYKNYSILYVVFEGTAYCQNFPPEQKITFRNLTVECNGVPFTPSWTTSFVEDVCDFRAHVVNPSTVTMTWNTAGTSDAAKVEAQYAKNHKIRESLKPKLRIPARKH